MDHIQPLHGVVELSFCGRTVFHNDDHAVQYAGHRQRIRHDGDGRKIDDHIVKHAPQQLRHAHHALRAQQLRRVRRHLARRDHAEVGVQVCLCHDAGIGLQPGKNMRKPFCASKLEPIAQRRRAHIALHEADAFSVLRQHIGKINRCRALSLALHGAGHADHAALRLSVVRQAEKQIRSQELIGLGRRKAQVFTQHPV